MASSSASRSSIRSDKQVQAHAHSSRIGYGHPPARSKLPSSRRSVTPTSRASNTDNDSETGRVRVAVRLRPRNAEDHLSDADFADCVELQPELKRLKLRKNNWNSESYRFDEVFTESASQRRVYDVVAKPVVESVLNGYNGTVMAYGQTGTGKTYTVGRLGKDDASERGIMVRALEDIIANTSPTADSVAVSYLQLYLESIQDLLAPEMNNIPIIEDPKTGEVFLPGAAVVKVQDLDQFLHLLQIGESNRHAANTNMNTESSRSHAILMVHICRSVKEKVEDEISSAEGATRSDVPTVRKSKLLIVDLAGSERLDKSGTEGHTLEETKSINLSLTSLGKCINALAENCPHIPIRDSKLTRLLRDSFGGSARTSLIITIGPSARHYAETASTIMFGQRAMKVVNMVKLKEEFDYESLCRKLENQVDHLTAELERQQKLTDTYRKEMEEKLTESQRTFAEAQKSLAMTSEFLEKENTRLVLENENLLKELDLQKENNSLMHDEVVLLEMNLRESKENRLDHSTYQMVLAETTQMYEKKIVELTKKLEVEYAHSRSAEEQLDDHLNSVQIQGRKEIDELKMELQEVCDLHEMTVNELQSLKIENEKILSEKAMLDDELHTVRQRLQAEEMQKKNLESDLVKLKRLVAGDDSSEGRKSHMKENIAKESSGYGSRTSLDMSNKTRERISGQRTTITKICEEVGVQKILALLRSEDLDVQIHAVKVVANLAAEDLNQEKIVEEGGLDALLMLLGSSINSTIRRVASGAIANLAMNEINQGLIVSKGGVQLLANIASKTDDPQTLRMVAGAIANLCGNETLHRMLKDDGGIKALLSMVRTGNSDILSQVARGMANFAKCESRGIVQGRRKWRSLLMEDGALKWLISNCSTTSDSTRRHIELALCHLAQNEDNTQDFILCGAVKELVRISHESSREDICNLAKKTLKLNPAFQAEMYIER